MALEKKSSILDRLYSIEDIKGILQNYQVKNPDCMDLTKNGLRCFEESGLYKNRETGVIKDCSSFCYDWLLQDAKTHRYILMIKFKTGEIVSFTDPIYRENLKDEWTDKKYRAISFSTKNEKELFDLAEKAKIDLDYFNTRKNDLFSAWIMENSEFKFARQHRETDKLEILPRNFFKKLFQKARFRIDNAIDEFSEIFFDLIMK